MTDITAKVPWKRAELAVNKFIKTAEIDVSRLRQFKKNIVENENAGDRPTVKLELGRAQQTISQLQSNLESIQGLRKQIKDEDVGKFDAKMNQTEKWIVEEINAFTDLDSDFIDYLGEDFHQLLRTGVDGSQTSIQYGTQLQRQKEISQAQSALNDELVATENQRQQIEKLAEDVVDAKEIMTSLHDMVHEQGEKVDNIENNVETTHANVKQGGLNLNKAVVLKAAGYTAIGAVCGALVGGPVGLLAGAKLGVVAAGAGMAVGATVGKKMKRMELDANEVELQNLHAATDMEETRVLRQKSVRRNSY